MRVRVGPRKPAPPTQEEVPFECAIRSSARLMGLPALVSA